MQEADRVVTKMEMLRNILVEIALTGSTNPTVIVEEVKAYKIKSYVLSLNNFDPFPTVSSECG